MKYLLNRKLFEDNMLSFGYHGDEFPNEDMKLWMEIELRNTNLEGDELETDMEMSRMRQDFIDNFSEEMRDLSYMEMLDVFEKTFDLANF